MTANDIRAAIGRQGLLTQGALAVRVQVTDAKVAYGVERLHVVPVGGKGAAWVNADRVTMDAPAPVTTIAIDRSEEAK